MTNRMNPDTPVTRSRPVVFGEVLYDCFPDSSRVLGGAPFNFAWHLQAFGLAPLLISRIGDDANGSAIRAAMEGWGMDTSGLQLDPAHPSGTVQVSVQGGDPSFDIAPDCAYDYIDPKQLPSLEGAGALYHGSLALRSPASRAALRALKARLRVPVFLDVNLRAPWWHPNPIQHLLAGATWVKLNAQELAVLRPDQTDDIALSAEGLQRRLGLELLVVTQGSKGALVCTAQGDRLEIRPSRGADAMDTVGAGDAFAAVLFLGLMRDWPLTTALERAQAFASAIVGIRGAVSTDPGFYRPFAETWRIGSPS